MKTLSDEKCLNRSKQSINGCCSDISVGNILDFQ